MDILSQINQRKTLLLAITFFALGLGMLGWLMLGRNNASAADPQATSDVWNNSTNADNELDQSAPTETIPTSTPEPPLIIYVSGAVMAPDVYVLAPNARTKDAILAAGGFSRQANPEAINLAAPLQDGQHLRVPTITDTSNTQPAPEIAPDPSDEQSSSAATTTTLLNLNAASAAELEELPGIGQALAARIVEYRQTNGPFTSIDDLRKVRGIGTSLFEQIAPLVTVEP